MASFLLKSIFKSFPTNLSLLSDILFLIFLSICAKKFLTFPTFWIISFLLLSADLFFLLGALSLISNFLGDKLLFLFFGINLI